MIPRPARNRRDILVRCGLLGEPGGPHGVSGHASGHHRKSPMAFKTQFAFRLPRGYVDENGAVHRDGIMRLATARDEILPLQDYRVQSNRAYLVIVLLSRVITKLGDHT